MVWMVVIVWMVRMVVIVWMVRMVEIVFTNSTIKTIQTKITNSTIKTNITILTHLPGANSGPAICKEVSLMSIEDKVKKIIAEKLSVDLSEVVPEASFVDDLGADSLDLVELIMSMEEEFDVEISDEDAEKITRVKDAMAYVAEH